MHAHHATYCCAAENLFISGGVGASCDVHGAVGLHVPIPIMLEIDSDGAA